MEPLFERLKKERIKSGMNQEEFAAFAGVSVQSQRNYESGRRSPDADYLERVSSEVDVALIISGRADVGVVRSKDGNYKVEFDPKIAEEAQKMMASFVVSFNIDEERRATLTPFLYSLLMTGHYGTTQDEMYNVFRDILNIEERKTSDVG